MLLKMIEVHGVGGTLDKYKPLKV